MWGGGVCVFHFYGGRAKSCRNYGQVTLVYPRRVESRSTLRVAQPGIPREPQLGTGFRQEPRGGCGGGGGDVIQQKVKVCQWDTTPALGIKDGARRY